MPTEIKQFKNQNLQNSCMCWFSWISYHQLQWKKNNFQRILFFSLKSKLLVTFLKIKRPNKQSSSFVAQLQNTNQQYFQHQRTFDSVLAVCQANTVDIQSLMLSYFSFISVVEPLGKSIQTNHKDILSCF